MANQLNTKSDILVKVLFLLTFLAGGTLQIVGIISNTSVSLLTLVILFFYYNFIEKKKDNYKPLAAILPLILCMLASSLINGFNIVLLLLYIALFALLPFIMYKFVYKSLNGRMKLVFKFLLIIGFIQLPVMLLQRTFFSSIIAIGSVKVSETDIDFGTFFVANDHALCFLLLSLIVYILNYDNTLSGKTRIITILWYSVTILLSNSRISSLFLITVFAFYFLRTANIRTIFFFITGLAGFAVVIALSGLYELLASKYSYLYAKIFENNYEMNDVYSSVEKGVADRTQIFYYYMDQPLKIIGEGPHNYFDPITKKFALLPNFSQLIWFYNDIGLIGVFIGIVILIKIYLRHQSVKSPAIVYLVMILGYSYFSNTFSDLAFLIIFYLFVINSKTIAPLKHKRKGKFYEPSLRTVPRLAKN